MIDYEDSPEPKMGEWDYPAGFKGRQEDNSLYTKRQSCLHANTTWNGNRWVKAWVCDSCGKYLEAARAIEGDAI